MTKIFVSYRRADSADTAERIVEHLTEISGKFSATDLFFDVDSIPVGANFRRYITERVSQCVVMLVVIGPDWVSVTNPDGSRRLDDPSDQVRLEVEAALSRQMTLIPILVRGASIPHADELPESIRELVDYNGLMVRHAPDFKSDIARLIEALEKIVGKSRVHESAAPSTGSVPQYTHFRTLSEHTGQVLGCVFSPDGKTLASSSLDNSIKLWDVDTGKAYRTMMGHKNTVRDIDFSPDGTRLVSVSDDKTFKLWTVGTGSLVDSITYPEIMRCCAWSPDGAHILTGSDEDAVTIWGASTRMPLHTLFGHTNLVRDCVFSPDGTMIASAAVDQTVRLWEVRTLRALHTLKGHKFNLITGVLRCAFSPDNKKVVSASWDSTLKVWDVASGEEIYTLKGHRNWVWGCAFSPDGRYIVSASADKTLKLWDAAHGTELYTLNGHTGSVFNCAFSPDGRYIASASDDKTLRIWGVRHG